MNNSRQIIKPLFPRKAEVNLSHLKIVTFVYYSKASAFLRNNGFLFLISWKGGMPNAGKSLSNFFNLSKTYDL